MNKAVLEAEHNDFIEEFYKALPEDPKKGDKKLFINRQLEQNPNAFVNEMYHFVNDKKVTHYIDCIFWGSIIQRDHYCKRTEKSVGGHGKVGAHGVGGEVGLDAERTQESHIATEKGTKKGVVSHSILPIHTLISEQFKATRIALSQAIKNYMSIKDILVKSQNARK